MTQSSTAPVSFADLGLSDTMLAAVDDLGYSEPTPVQAAAIPEVLAGRDLLAAAQTGTGKTAAFLLPTMGRLGHARRGQGPLMLVVTPTRELASQIEDVAGTIAARSHHRCTTVVGGVGYQPQIDALRRGCDVLVATPGRLVDLIERDACRLGGVEVLVLDEADRMLDMGFMPQMRKIVAQLPADRQTLLLSATLDDSVLSHVKGLVHDPARVEIAHKGVAADTIDQYVLPVSLEAKNALLAKVLKQAGPEHVIVFTRTKHRADACCRRLRRAGISASPIHGNRSQNQRERALADFRDNKTDVLVATDVLARGIDISDVRYVVNFDVPEDPEDYIHRIGRTGRAGEVGWALTFVTVNDLDDFRRCEALMNRIVPTYIAIGAENLGEEPPALDPNRIARPAKGIPRKKRVVRRAKEAAERKAASKPAKQEQPDSAKSKRKPTQAKQGSSAKPKRHAMKSDQPQAEKRRTARRPNRAGSRRSGDELPRGFVNESTSAKRKKGSRRPGDLGGRR